MRNHRSYLARPWQSSIVISYWHSFNHIFEISHNQNSLSSTIELISMRATYPSLALVQHYEIAAIHPHTTRSRPRLVIRFKNRVGTAGSRNNQMLCIENALGRRLCCSLRWWMWCGSSWSQKKTEPSQDSCFACQDDSLRPREGEHFSTNHFVWPVCEESNRRSRLWDNLCAVFGYVRFPLMNGCCVLSRLMHVY